MKEKNVFVMGGSSGIGLALVKMLVEKDYIVFAGSRSAGALEEVPDAKRLSIDVTADEWDLEQLPDVLHGLVYCPGTIVLKPFQRLSTEDFIEDYRVNLIGAVKTIQSCLKRLKKSPTGASIVLFSTVAVKAGMPFHASVASAKGAVEGLTRSLAAEFAPRIRVNAIAPSLTDTPLARDLLSTDARRQASADRHPLKRIGTPGDIAGLAAHLLSDSGAWTTGQVIQVDGGMGSLRVFR